MSKFNIGDKVISNDSYYLSEEVGTIVGIDTRENASRKYLVKFDSLDISEGWAYGCFRDISLLIIEPYDGYAIWLDDLVKVKEECKEDIMSKFNIGDKVISNDDCYSGKDVGVIVGIDPREDVKGGKYLVKFNSLDIFSRWVNEDDLVKVEDECKENECEEDIRTKFESVRKQKEEIIKKMGEKVLELTLEIKEIEHEIEKIKKEWHLD